MRKLVYGSLLSILFTVPARAQGDLDDIIKGSLSDANYLMEGYAGPVMRGLGVGLNQGWYNTAKPHKSLGFDLTFTGTLIYFPSEEDLYTVDNTKLTSVKLISYDGQQISPTGTGQVPTIFGPSKAPTYEYVSDGTTFDGPEGNDLKEAIKLADAMPVPMYQIGIGLPKNFEIKFRFAPTLTLGDLKFNLIGGGIMHDVKQYIPGIKTLPFDLSVFAGYTKMKAELKIDATAGENQRAELSVGSGTFQALISKKISVITFYGGVGYETSSSTLAMLGTYDTDDDGLVDATDPVDLDFSKSGMRATLGMRLKLAAFTLHGDYTLGPYNALNAGFGINVR